jgi:integrase
MNFKRDEKSHATIASAIDSTAKGKDMARRRLQNSEPYMNRNKTLWKATFAEYRRDSSGVERRKRKEITLGPTATMTKRQAAHALRPYLDKANASAFNPTKTHKDILCALFSDQSVKTNLILSKPSTQASMKTHANRFKQEFGAKSIRQLDGADVQKLVAALAGEGLEPKTIRNYWITIRLITNAALVQGYRDQPLPKPKLPRAFRKKPRCFSLEEVAKIFAALEGDDELLALYWCAAETGLRAGELDGMLLYESVYNMDYMEISRSMWNGRMNTPKTPNALRKVAISEQLAELLADQRRRVFKRFPERPLFSLQVGYARKAKLQPLLLKLGIPRAGFHAFRHFNASLMDSLRIPLKTRQERLGHASTGSLTLDVYTHSNWEDHLEAARLIGDAIEKAVDSVSLTAAKEEGPAGGGQQALDNKQRIGCGGQI